MQRLRATHAPTHSQTQGDPHMQTRRAVMLSAAAAFAALPVVRAQAAAATPRGGGPSEGSPHVDKPHVDGPRERGSVRLTLPEPSGPCPVGAVSLRLVDASRSDPWVTSQPYRELMIGIRYPARTVDGYRRNPQMLPGEAAGFAELNSFSDVP